jgi:hypothetical protein
MSYVMQKCNTELLNLAKRWESQLKIIPEYKDNGDLSWWPTSSGGPEHIINDVPKLPNVPNQLNWDSYMDDTSSVGDIEGPTEEDPGQMEDIEGNDYREMVDPMFDAWFEEGDSEDEAINGDSNKRKKFV